MAKLFDAGSEWFWAMAQFVAVVVSLWFIHRQLKLQRQGNMLHAFGGIDERWNSDPFLRLRQLTCCRYRADELKIDREQGDVLGFFEDLGIYLERRVFDRKLIWDKYSYYIEYYWLMYKSHIAEFQASDSDNTWFDKFAYLNNEMAKEAGRRKVKYGSRTQAEIRRFTLAEGQATSAMESGIVAKEEGAGTGAS